LNETARIEAFSDGIFSIAATLLVLELKRPATDLPFWIGLLHQWPGYVSFVLSFFFIGIMWINHHRLFVHIAKADDLMMAVNLLLLLGVVFVPYPTSLMASSLTMLDSDYSRNVAIFYNAGYFVISLLFNLLWYVCRKRNLLDNEFGHERVHSVSNQYKIGPFLYAACLVMTWWSVPISLAMNASLAIYFLLPPRHRKPRPHDHAEIQDNQYSHERETH
jgi:uncharacterized membrane protein